LDQVRARLDQMRILEGRLQDELVSLREALASATPRNGE
jgi:hypothetical protein